MWPLLYPLHMSKKHFTYHSSIIPSSRKFLLPSILYIDFHVHLVPESGLPWKHLHFLLTSLKSLCYEFPWHSPKPLSLGMVPKCHKISERVLSRNPEKWKFEWKFVSLSLCRTLAMKIQQCFPPWDKVIACKGEHMGNELRTAWSFF